MGASHSSTSKAGKFAGTPKRQRACSCYEGAATAPSIRRNASNINRNAKEFSKFWQNGGNFQGMGARAMSIDPTIRSPPRVVPSGNVAAAAANNHTPPPSAYSTPRDSYRNESLERRGPGLNRVHSVKYNTFSPPARCNGMQAAPTTPTTLYHRHPSYSYHHRCASNEAELRLSLLLFMTPDCPVERLLTLSLLEWAKYRNDGSHIELFCSIQPHAVARDRHGRLSNAREHSENTGNTACQSGSPPLFVAADVF
ncbi:hypothetical protein PRIPAC_81456 [Pristionchus pacificus]|uniref:Uncharacterized protein n=1 Tax=Pristionchus pacificus TaxID=54126 RepID=A0A2A6BVU5_PRIPA|nr:hypothetical protein PRIPAC_81456 [Pristionchus pacificus]|eukprot:PDM70040.1 hypothetical protein PRIPAC_49252 [Pristionchus pacificus]